MRKRCFTYNRSDYPLYLVRFTLEIVANSQKLENVLNIWVWSDLHLEQQYVEFPNAAPALVDVIVCAGDWTTADQLEGQMKKVVQDYNLPIIFVAGNHEYQGALTFEASKASMASIVEKSRHWNQRVTILDNENFIYKDVVFIGSTLWTDFMYQADSHAELPWRVKEAEALIRDFTAIQMASGECFSPSFMLQQNKLSLRYIYETCERFSPKRKVVISHHIPHEAASDAVYQNSASNYLYASSASAFENLMHSHAAPDLWICGHTHQVTDIQVGQTRIISNPYGYRRFKSERENAFRWDYVISV